MVNANMGWLAVEVASHREHAEHSRRGYAFFLDLEAFLIESIQLALLAFAQVSGAAGGEDHCAEQGGEGEFVEHRLYCLIDVDALGITVLRSH